MCNMPKLDYSLKELKGICNKKNYSSFWLDHTTRPLARLIIKGIMNTPITPNQITLFSFILGIISCFTFVTASYPLLAFGGVLLFISKTFDCVDGQLSRLKKMGSKFGGWFDGIVDFLLLNLIPASIGFGLFFRTGNPLYLIMSIITIIAVNNFIFSFVTEDKLVDKTAVSELAPVKSSPLKWDVALEYLIIMTGALLNRLDVVLLILLSKNSIWFVLKDLLLIKRHYPKKLISPPQ